MASNAASSSRTPRAVVREASPLPAKVGEFGYQPPKDDELDDRRRSTDSETTPMGRHPADTPWPANADARRPTAQTPARPVGRMPFKSTSFFFRLTNSNAPPLVGGLHGPSLTRAFFIIALIAFTIGGWTLTIQHLNAAVKKDADAEAPGQGDADDQDGSSLMPGATTVFVHIAFAVATLLELVFFERAIFQLRAERWRWRNPGAMHDTDLALNASTSFGLAPWTRPPLPTYAAALGERGTGDVEDAAIAVPPPPAYGNERDSTLLLAAWMPTNLFRSRSSRSQTASSVSRGSRSLRLVDWDADGIRAAIRARQLELSLARMEQGGATDEQS